jgi:hypothetical protein
MVRQAPAKPVRQPLIYHSNAARFKLGVPMLGFHLPAGSNVQNKSRRVLCALYLFVIHVGTCIARSASHPPKYFCKVAHPYR